MYKYAKFSFEELDVPDHWVAFPAFGALISSSVDHTDEYQQVDIQLSTDEVYQVSFDQSSSNTGMFIKNYKNTEAYMVEISRARGQDASDYIYKLELLIHQIFEGINVTHLVYEKPIKAKSFRSSQVLFQLEGMLIGLSHRYSEFKTVKVDNITNSSWRSVIIDDSLGTGYTRKELSRVSVNHVWEWTRSYGYSLGTDEDIFEAIGIMMGWFYKSFDHLGRPYVRGTPATRPIGGLILPGISGEQAMQLLKDKNIEAQLFIENPENSIYRNLSALTERYKTICVEFSSKYAMLAICVESNIMWADYDHLTVILTDAACIDAGLREVSGGVFQFVI